MLSELVDFIFPRQCHLCDTVLNGESRYICPHCLANLPRTHYHRIRNNPMELRFAGLFTFERAAAHFFHSHNSEMASLIYDLKYHKYQGLGYHLGNVAGMELLSGGFMADIDGIMPVPMHFFKQARRGYNPAASIAEGLSAATRIPVLDNLKAGRAHRTQTALSLQQRRTNTANLFTVAHPAELPNQHILIVDDVCTTGATLTSCATALLTAVPSLRLSLFALTTAF